MASEEKITIAFNAQGVQALYELAASVSNTSERLKKIVSNLNNAYSEYGMNFGPYKKSINAFLETITKETENIKKACDGLYPRINETAKRMQIAIDASFSGNGSGSEGASGSVNASQGNNAIHLGKPPEDSPRKI